MKLVDLRLVVVGWWAVLIELLQQLRGQLGQLIRPIVPRQPRQLFLEGRPLLGADPPGLLTIQSTFDPSACA
jgi:hypothetical protein